MQVILAPMRRRYGLLGLICLVAFVSSSVLLLTSSPDLSSEQVLLARVSELEARAQHLDLLYRTRLADVQAVTQHLWTLQAFVDSFSLFSSDLSSEQVLLARVSELEARAQHLDLLYRTRLADVQAVTQHLWTLQAAMSAVMSPSDAVNGTSGGLPSPPGGGGLPPMPQFGVEDLQVLRNLSGPSGAFLGGNGGPGAAPIRMPSPFHFLPHFLDSPDSLRPAFVLGAGRRGVSIVLGVPTVRRDAHSYLLDTLTSLVSEMSPEEANDTLIVVMIAETDLDYVKEVAAQIKNSFDLELQAGLIEVMSPSATYYPDMTRLRRTMGDSLERVRWRAKQNLDFAFLMMYCQPRATFYVQLEDDILARPNYVSMMKKFTLEKIAQRSPWFVIEFSQLGFIGKLFRCVELPTLVQFFLMFYNDKPVDWLLDNVIFTKVCNHDKDNKHCSKAKAELWTQYKPSLFQHVGTHSSLKGKMQWLKDKQFGKVPLFFAHANPPAVVTSAIRAYKQYNLRRAYKGESFFWGLLPQPGDILSFRFTPPLRIHKFLFRSGNYEHPLDRFYNSTIEVRPVVPVNTATGHSNCASAEAFVVIGQFDGAGVAEGVISSSFSEIEEMRICVNSESDKWAILSEISIETASSR